MLQEAIAAILPCQKAVEAGPALPALSLATPGTEDASELAALWVAALLLAVCNGLLVQLLD